MRILLDECIPKQLKREFPGHFVLTVAEAGWAGLQNGELLSRAESQFEAFITLDSSMPYQQNLSSARIGILLIKARSNDISDLRPLMPEVLKRFVIAPTRLCREDRRLISGNRRRG